MAQTVKNLSATWETWVQSLGWEDPLRKGMATHSSILGWRIPWTEESGGLQSMRSQRVRRDLATEQEGKKQFDPLRQVPSHSSTSGVSLGYHPCALLFTFLKLLHILKHFNIM